MLRVFVVLLGLLVLPAAAHPPSQMNAASEKGIAEEIIDFRRRMAEAIKAKDAAALRAMYAEAFQHIHTTAKTDGRDARIVSALAGDPVIETAAVEDLTVRAHAGGWVAIATATSPITSKADGKLYAVRWMAVYVRTDASWQLAASQATRSHEIVPK
jgi:ketosteroid isomerase-like protein